MDNGGYRLRAKVKATTMQGDLFGIGTIIGYCDVPQLCILRPDGSMFWWRADLCAELDPDTVRILEHAGVRLDPDERDADDDASKG